MKKLLLALAASLFAAPALASCPQFFAGGQEPVIVNQKLTTKTHELCFAEFATLHSGVSRGPVWSAEHLVGKLIAQGHPDRVNAFHAETNLPADERAEMADYKGSGYDRGHMAPSADMVTENGQHDSFSLANMVPQLHANNAGLWSKIEASMRDLAVSEGELYVVTGPIFEGTKLDSLKGRVLIPPTLFKAVYDPKKNAAAVYIVRNSDVDHYEVVPLDKAEARIGIHLFPAEKPKLLDLPKP